MPVDLQRAGDVVVVGVEEAAEVFRAAAVEHEAAAQVLVPHGHVAQPRLAAELEAGLEGLHVLLAEEVGPEVQGVVRPDDGLEAHVEGVQAVGPAEVVRQPHAVGGAVAAASLGTAGAAAGAGAGAGVGKDAAGPHHALLQLS